MESTGKRFLISLAALIVYSILTIIGLTKIVGLDFVNESLLILSFICVFIGAILFIIIFDAMMDSRKRKTRIGLTLIASIFAVGLPFLLTAAAASSFREIYYTSDAFWTGMCVSPFLFGSLLLCSYYINVGMWENKTVTLFIQPCAFILSGLICILCALGSTTFVIMGLPIILGGIVIGSVVFMTVKYGTPFY